MRNEVSIHDQRNRLYRSLPPFGTLSGGRVLEESRKLDALVLRYYRTLGNDPYVFSEPARTESEPETEPSAEPASHAAGAVTPANIDPVPGEKELHD